MTTFQSIKYTLGCAGLIIVPICFVLAARMVMLPAAPASSRPAEPKPVARPQVMPRPQPFVSLNKWEAVRMGDSQMDDSPSMAFALKAENSIAVWLGTRRPALIVRCQEQSTEAYIQTGSAAATVYGELDAARVRVRWDDDAAREQVWHESTDHEALFVPNGVAFTRRLAASHQLRVEFTPFNASPVVMNFDTVGFEDHARAIAQTCKWKL